MKKITDYTETELVNLAEELKDRTIDFVQDELYQMLQDLDLVSGEFDENETDLLNAISDRFYNPVLQYINAKLLEDIKHLNQNLDNK